MKRTVVTLQVELRKQLGKDAKTIFNKIDRMLAKNRKRKDIEAMMAREIAACTRKRMDELRCMVT